MPTKFASTRYCFGLLLMVLTLAACAKRTPAPAIALASPTAITGATRTAAPMVTRTLSPTPSPTITPNFATIVHAKVTYVPSRTPTLTRTRGTPTATFLPTSTFAPSLTPATPLGPEAYRLKEWTAEDALAAVAEADGLRNFGDGFSYARTPDPHYMAGDFLDYEFTIGQEAISRFPEAAHKIDLQWKLGLDAIIWSDKPLAKFFLPALEDKVNGGEITGCNVTADDMEVVSYTVNNLLGDGKPALVCLFDYLSLQATVVTGEGQAGKYSVVSLDTYWFRENHQHNEISIVDRNNNGQPEIQVIYSFTPNPDIWSHAEYCSSELHLYEWRGAYPGGYFVDLAKNLKEISEYPYSIADCEKYWLFSETQAGAQIITSSEPSPIYGRKCLDFKLLTTYEWNGATYESTGQQPNILDNKVSLACAVGWADWAGWQNDTALRYLAAAMEQWPAELDELWGPAAQDYFRFKLGTWYALRGDKELAHRTLESVRDHPANPRFDMASRLARAFLLQFEAGRPFLACRIVTRMLSKSDVGKGEPDYLYVDPYPEAYAVAWGFSAPYWLDGRPNNICEASPLFPSAIQSIHPYTTASLLDWFFSQQIPVRAITQSDVNDDGRLDWLALIKVNEYAGWWALMPTPSGLQATYVIYDFEYGNNFFATVSPSRDEPGAHILRVGGDEWTFRITSNNSKWQATDVRRIILPQAPTQSERIAQVESLLFESNAVVEAQTELQHLLAERIAEENYDYGNSLPRLRPRLLYLLGLTYELSGDEANAVRTYWQLWHDYPGNPYTFIARRKLVEVNG